MMRVNLRIASRTQYITGRLNKLISGYFGGELWDGDRYSSSYN